MKKCRLQIIDLPLIKKILLSRTKTEIPITVSKDFHNFSTLVK